MREGKKEEVSAQNGCIDLALVKRRSKKRPRRRRAVLRKTAKANEKN